MNAERVEQLEREVQACEAKVARQGEHFAAAKAELARMSGELVAARAELEEQ